MHEKPYYFTVTCMGNCAFLGFRYDADAYSLSMAKFKLKTKKLAFLGFRYDAYSLLMAKFKLKIKNFQYQPLNK